MQEGTHHGRLILERCFAAWLQGKDHRDTNRGYEPPKWVRESSKLERYYRTGFHGQNYN